MKTTKLTIYKHLKEKILDYIYSIIWHQSEFTANKTTLILTIQRNHGSTFLISEFYNLLIPGLTNQWYGFQEIVCFNSITATSTSRQSQTSFELLDYFF